MKYLKHLLMQPSPCLIFRDDKLIVRVVKDYFKEDIEEILIDDKPTFDEAFEFIRCCIARPCS